MDTGALVLRDALMRCIRAFFHERGFIEVETPIRLKTPCMELHIDAEPAGDHYLRTSPEIFHKQLLAAGHGRIFEIGKCFRQGEYGRLHHPEYTMLEWYRSHADYMDMLEETRLLVEAVAALRNRGFGEWTLLGISEAFREFAGWDPVAEYDADRFDIDLVEKVEPALGRIAGPVVLIDYPAEAAALSRRKPGNPLVAERWELYIDGIELANAYSELTDAREQRGRFEACADRRRELGKAVYPIDERFVEAVGRMPPSGGVAMGIDRLLMVLAGADSLDGLVAFRSPCDA